MALMCLLEAHGYPGYGWHCSVCLAGRLDQAQCLFRLVWEVGQILFRKVKIRVMSKDKKCLEFRDSWLKGEIVNRTNGKVWFCKGIKMLFLTSGLI